jgi:hypothetical protein
VFALGQRAKLQHSVAMSVLCRTAEMSNLSPDTPTESRQNILDMENLGLETGLALSGIFSRVDAASFQSGSLNIVMNWISTSLCKRSRRRDQKLVRIGVCRCSSSSLRVRQFS